MSSATTWMNKQQIWLYLLAIAAGCLVGGRIPNLNSVLGATINPFLGILLYITFLSTPLTKLVEGFKDFRFISVLVVTNFMVIPILVYVLTRFIQADKAVLIGVALVLLAPCVDYVIVFSGLAGGENHKLLAATPLLLLLQMLLIPIYMYVIVGESSLKMPAPEPFAATLALLIFLPLVLAFTTQVLGNKFACFSDIACRAENFMVPAMMGTLFSVVGSQIHTLTDHAESLLQAALVFIIFIPVAGFATFHIGKAFGLPATALRAVSFSGVTRNSLVVLPIALALPIEYSLASSVVVTQTLIELVAMLVMVRVVPLLIRATPNNPLGSPRG
ncbi:arsenic resistance protein [Glutamicibacter sp. TV12E]|uniref:arsenic resistance protein n=1 Tax=Glutamicibacter sp. TV12E TaxID=3446362 RepID=UPI004034C08A